MGRPLSGASAPKGSRPAIDRFTPQSERQFPKAEKSVVALAAAPVESKDPEVKNVSEADAIAARKLELEQERIDRDMKAYAIKKAQKEVAAKLSQRKK
jgi:hypothetical protein